MKYMITLIIYTKEIHVPRKIWGSNYSSLMENNHKLKDKVENLKRELEIQYFWMCEDHEGKRETFSHVAIAIDLVKRHAIYGSMEKVQNV